MHVRMWIYSVSEHLWSEHSLCKFLASLAMLLNWDIPLLLTALLTMGSRPHLSTCAKECIWQLITKGATIVRILEALELEGITPC